MSSVVWTRDWSSITVFHFFTTILALLSLPTLPTLPAPSLQSHTPPHPSKGLRQSAFRASFPQPWSLSCLYACAATRVDCVCSHACCVDRVERESHVVGVLESSRHPRRQTRPLSRRPYPPDLSPASMYTASTQRPTRRPV